MEWGFFPLQKNNISSSPRRGHDGLYDLHPLVVDLGVRRGEEGEEEEGEEEGEHPAQRGGVGQPVDQAHGGPVGQNLVFCGKNEVLCKMLTKRGL